jgi:hypothetical protein
MMQTCPCGHASAAAHAQSWIVSTHQLELPDAIEGGDQGKERRVLAKEPVMPRRWARALMMPCCTLLE